MFVKTIRRLVICSVRMCSGFVITKSCKGVAEVQYMYQQKYRLTYISYRVTARALCPMELSSYPFDVQVCPLTLVSCK
jgi:hypothetical protein